MTVQLMRGDTVNSEIKNFGADAKLTVLLIIIFDSLKSQMLAL